jgi:hypothetical protein
MQDEDIVDGFRAGPSAVDPRDAIPEDERITQHDLSKVFDDDDGDADPFDPDVIPSDDDEPPPYLPHEGEA